MIWKSLKTIIATPFMVVGAIIIWALSLFVILFKASKVIVEDIWHENK